jgi:hypothetical protein
MKQEIVIAAICLVSAGPLSAQDASTLDDKLLEAVWHGECAAVRGLLKKGANPDARSEKVGTALMQASAICEAPVVALLLDKGADLEARDKRGWTPLLHAVERSRPSGVWREIQDDVVKLLLARRADATVKDNDGSTAMHHAAGQRNPDMVPMLLAAGLPADTRNKDGETPLLLAVRRGELANVQALLAAGADPNQRSNAGHSILNVATAGRDAEIVRALRQRGAREGPPPPSHVKPASGPADRSPIDGVSLAQWARANARLVAGVAVERVAADLKLTKARWEKVHEQWTERLAQHSLELGQEYADAFYAESNAFAPAGPSAEPIPFEKWIEVLEATHAASVRVPELYGMSPDDWTRVSAWWRRKMDAREVDKAAYDKLSAKYEKELANHPPTRQGTVVRPGFLESNSEPVPFERWVEMEKAMAAGINWTLKRQGFTLGNWIRANHWWGSRFNRALLGLDHASAAERAETVRMNAEQVRLSAIYKRKYAEGVPW